MNLIHRDQGTRAAGPPGGAQAPGRADAAGVVLVTPQLAFGGAEVHVVSLANGLHRRGYRVAVVSSGGGTGG